MRPLFSLFLLYNEISHSLKSLFILKAMNVSNILSDVHVQFERSAKPVALPYHKSESFNCIVLGFKAGMILNDHKSRQPAKLLILKGEVLYISGSESVQLQAYDFIEIAVDVVHRVTALSDAICILTQG